MIHEENAKQFIQINLAKKDFNINYVINIIYNIFQIS